MSSKNKKERKKEMQIKSDEKTVSIKKSYQNHKENVIKLKFNEIYKLIYSMERKY